jgi:hypothetical protein
VLVEKYDDVYQSQYENILKLWDAFTLVGGLRV